MTDLRGEYQRRLAERRERIAALDRVNFALSNLRLAIALPGAVLLWMAFVRVSIAPWWPIGAWLAFAVVAVIHATRLQRFQRAKAAEGVYVRGLDRLDGRWTGTGRDGSRFLEHHPYAGGLDLFGPASLFEFLNTTRTDIGELALARWLSAPAPLDEVRARQSAVAELQPMLDFREDIAVLAPESPIGHTSALSAWSASAVVRFNPAVRAILIACAIMSVALFILVARDTIALEWFVLWVLLEAGIAAIWRHDFHRVNHGVETPEHVLGLVAELLARLESERFASPRLTGLHEALITDGALPSARIAELRRLVSWLDSTHNLLFAPIAYVLMLRPLLAVAIARWHAAYGTAVARWLEAAGEFEALAALANYSYEHPEYPFPDLSADGPLYEAEGIGHPLLPHGGVKNDVLLGGAGPRVIIVSGSNMSGKSTLLRSVGVSVVLALAGAPVAAKRLKLSALVLGATLHIEDSLHAGHSRFFAEILRIRTIAEAARGATPMLFLLDEILHGTNSHDRRIGAEGIVRALTALGAVGLVTTHDLALTELPATLPGADNWHFEDQLVDGKLVFDYRMRPGVVEHSNAVALMRAIGLDI